MTFPGNSEKRPNSVTASMPPLFRYAGMDYALFLKITPYLRENVRSNDPDSAVIKLRQFREKIIEKLQQRKRPFCKLVTIVLRKTADLSTSFEVFFLLKKE